MSNPSSVTSAIEAWKRELGVASVMDDEESLNSYMRAACGSKRHVFAALFPKSHEHVERIVAIANEFLTPLYPISRGKQWGMGSKLPVRDGAAIVDLSGMDRIIEINEPFHYAVVEPGVTQGQLIDYISERGLDLMLNVTGSTSDTSLIGNAMDRGVGYFDSRAHGISNMTVVLGSGRTIKTGFGHYENAKTKNLYSYGVGPSLDGLFPQGNFGIVTSACIDLTPKPEAHMAAIIKIEREQDLPQLIDSLTRLRRRGVISSVVHVGDCNRAFMTMAPLLYDQLMASGWERGEKTRNHAVTMLENEGFGPWSAAVGVYGTHGRLKLARAEIKKAVKASASVSFLSDKIIHQIKALANLFSFIPAVRRKRMILNAIQPVYGWTRGDTTDVSIKALYWSSGEYEDLNNLDPDASSAGVLYCLPIIPAAGEEVVKLVEAVRATFKQYDFEAAITVNLLDSKSMEGVISLAFSRNDDQRVLQAKECMQKMEAKCVEMGYPPYRVGINAMEHVIDSRDSFWCAASDVKNALDPNHIIAPGRYNLA